MDLQKTVRPQVPDFEPYSPGLAIEEIRERYGLGRVIKLASNENPLGTSPVVQQALAENAALAFRYAQAGTPRLNRAIAEHLGVPEGAIVTGNGSDEVIDLIVRVKARPGVDNVIAFKPSFSLYRLQSKLCGVEFRQAPLNADFSFPWDDLLALADENTALCFVTTPDNPSGYAPTAAELEALARRLPPQCLLVIDEAYMDFVEDQDAHSLLSRRDEFPNVAFLRTFSKMYGLAGLRLGYGVLPEWLGDYCRRVKLPFSVNVLAEIAGIAALADRDFVCATRTAVCEGRSYLRTELESMGFRVHPSHANFILVDMPADAPFDASALVEGLLRRGIIIRPLGSYSLPRSVRITVGDGEENREFIRAVREFIANA
ncbi:histidinol-phosphate aminotransferase [Desulfobaculum xiamenense]|uniref:Histidinol-phosphate aminotransferase n=1 Tax=Desulfobaculum xiamenense TaxID=995050 RepID=A0A846QH99_9BACT|nr:histidinol-phosphate transaminase [Desulfobaculum xiamenense]NJB68196.1 histidinol-phosphate aminotransferase [Desulfobaculum xiamenense]